MVQKVERLLSLSSKLPNNGRLSESWIRDSAIESRSTAIEDKGFGGGSTQLCQKCTRSAKLPVVPDKRIKLPTSYESSAGIGNEETTSPLGHRTKEPRGAKRSRRDATERGERSFAVGKQPTGEETGISSKGAEDDTREIHSIPRVSAAIGPGSAGSESQTEGLDSGIAEQITSLANGSQKRNQKTEEASKGDGSTGSKGEDPGDPFAAGEKVLCALSEEERAVQRRDDEDLHQAGFVPKRDDFLVPWLDSENLVVGRGQDILPQTEANIHGEDGPEQ